MFGFCSAQSEGKKRVAHLTVNLPLLFFSPSIHPSLKTTIHCSIHSYIRQSAHSSAHIFFTLKPLYIFLHFTNPSQSSLSTFTFVFIFLYKPKPWNLGLSPITLSIQATFFLYMSSHSKERFSKSSTDFSFPPASRVTVQ